MIVTLGRTVGNYDYIITGNRKYVYRVTVGASDFVSDCAFLNIHNVSNPSGLRFVIYDATGSAGSPGALVAASDELLSLTLGTNWFHFTSPVTLSAGAVYYFGVHSPTAIELSCVGGASTGYYAADTYSDGTSSTFGTAVSSALELVAGLLNIESGIAVERLTGSVVLSPPLSVSSLTGVTVLSPPLSVSSLTGVAVVQPWPVPIAVVANALLTIVATRPRTASAVISEGTVKTITANGFIDGAHVGGLADATISVDSPLTTTRYAPLYPTVYDSGSYAPYDPLDYQ
jgi:hypothetical protein